MQNRTSLGLPRRDCSKCLRPSSYLSPSFFSGRGDHSVAVFHANPPTRRPLLIGSLAAVRLALLLPLRPCAVQVDAVAVAVAPAAALSPSPVHLWNGVYQIIIIIITAILSSIHLSLQVQCDTCQLDRSPVGLDLGSSTILLGQRVAQ